MKVSISKSEVKGKVTAPASKSFTIRGLMCAALTKGESEIINPLIADDTEVAADVLSKVGVRITKEKGLWRVSGGNLRAPDPGVDLYCGESATTLRFMIAICSLIPGKCRLTAGPTLSKRPVRPLVDALRRLKVKCSCEGDVAPVVVEGGVLKGGMTELPGNISSQFVSALLLIAPFALKGLRIRLTSPLVSRSYIMLTLCCLREFGIKVSRDFDKFSVVRQAYEPAQYEVESDWSSASYFLALGALSEGGIEIENLNSASSQGDRALIEFLREMGAMVAVTENSIIVKKLELNAIEANLSDCIDLLPTVAALVSLAKGTSVFTGVEKARIKESDRVAAVREGLGRMNIRVKEERNKFAIVGGEPGSAVIDAKRDHRIAMSFSIIGTVIGDTVIDGAEHVAKTFPQFWEVLKSIGCKLEITDE